MVENVGLVLLRATEIISAAMASTSSRPTIKSFFDPATATVTHVLHDPATRRAVVVDPVLDFDAASGRVSRTSIGLIIGYIREQELVVDLILETHVHADHLSGAAILRDILGVPVGIGRAVNEVSTNFADIFASKDEASAAYDILFEDGDEFRVGHLEAVALHVPGHTPADMAYVIGDVVLTGDTLFMPDFGTARADFPGGDAQALFRSTRRLLSLPDETRLLHCHDYPPAGRDAPAWISTVAEQRAANIHVRDGMEEAAFVVMRKARDATLATPALMLPSVQVNLRGGALPDPAPNGRRYLVLPLDAI